MSSGSKFKKNIKWYFLLLLILTNLFIWQAVFRDSEGDILKVVFFDVNQGDSIFIEAPNGNQVLIDGGANNKVLRELSQVMSFSDRSIDMLIATHPDKDHIGGLIPVIGNYEIGLFLRSGVKAESEIFKSLENSLEKSEIDKIIARRGMIFDLGDNVRLKILFPDRDVSRLEANTASVIAQIEHGEISFLLTGDSPKSIENFLVSLDDSQLDSEVLKVGHHGSRTSTGELFLEKVSPAVAVVSAGEGNRYGHPHPEILSLLEKNKIEVLKTSDFSSITFLSDGEKVWSVD